MAANAGKPFGDHGVNTHYGSTKGQIGFKQVRLSGGGQEESIVASSRLAMAKAQIKEGERIQELFSKKGTTEPAWGLKDTSGLLYQGGKYNISLNDLTKTAQPGLNPYVHAAKIEMADLEGNVSKAQTFFAYGPNLTASRLPNSSTTLTQVKDFQFESFQDYKNKVRQASPRKPAKEIVEDYWKAHPANKLNLKQKENIKTLVQNSYESILDKILAEAPDVDVIATPKLTSNIYSRIYIGEANLKVLGKDPRVHGAFIDSEASTLVNDETLDWILELLKKKKYEDKFRNKAFLFTEPNMAEGLDVRNITEAFYAHYLKENSESDGPQKQYWEKQFDEYGKNWKSQSVKRLKNIINGNFQNAQATLKQYQDTQNQKKTRTNQLPVRDIHKQYSSMSRNRQGGATNRLTRQQIESIEYFEKNINFRVKEKRR